MKKTVSAILAAALTATMSLATPMPASAQSVTFNFSQGERVVRDYCTRNNWRYSDCRDWRDNRNRWNRDRYQRFYRSHRSGLDNLASGLFGFTFGAIVGSALANQQGRYDVPVRLSSRHVAWCEDRYRSYRVSDNSFQPYNGPRRECISPYSR